MSVPKFSSILKDVKDLLTKPYCYDQKVELKTKAANGAAFTTDASISGDNGSASANFKVEHKYENIKIDKLSVGTNKKIVGEFSMKGAATNTDVSFKFTDGSRSSGADIKASVGAVYKDADNATVTIDADVVDGPNFDLTGVFGYKGFLFGGSATVATSLLSSADAKDAKEAAPAGLADYNALVGYRTEDYTLAAQTRNSLANVDVSLIHAASPSLSTGAIVSFGTSGSAAPFNLTFGGQYKLDSTSTVTGTADSKGKVSMAYKQKLNDFATIAVSGQVDAMALDSDNHKFGLKLNLGN